MQKKEEVQNMQRITTEMIETERTRLDEHKEKTVSLCQKYLDDLAEKEDRITTQINAYAEELSKLEKQEQEQSKKVAQAIANGEAAAAATAEAELDNIENKLTAIRKKEMLIKGAAIKGDSSLYADCVEAWKKTEEEAKNYEQRLRALLDQAREEQKRIEDTVKQFERTLGMYKSGYWGSPDFTGEARTVFTRVDRHYRELDRKEQEAKEWTAKEKREAEEERKQKENRLIFA